MNTIQEVHKCPFCGSKDVEEINRFSIINNTSMFSSPDERIDEEGNTMIVYMKPVKYATQQQFRCNSCHSCFETRNYDTDVETYRRR